MTDLGRAAVPEAGLASRQAVGSADSQRTSAGSVDSPRQTARPADSPRLTAESAATPADFPRSTAGSVDSPQQTVGSVDSPRQTARPADSPRRTAESATTPADSPRSTAGSADSPRSTAGSADSPRLPAGSVDSPRHTGESAGTAADSPRRGTSPPQADRPSAGGPLLVTVAAGWRVAGDQAAARAVRVATPHTARVPLQDWVDPSTCVLLERDTVGGGSERPGLTVTVAPGCQLAIAEVALLSEFGRCQLFGDLGEYLCTEEAELMETVDDTDVLCLRHRCRLPVAQVTLQCVSAAGRCQLWVYGLEVTLQPAAARPAAAFSLPAVLARLETARAPLPPGAEALRAALAAEEPLSAGALAAALADRRRAPADPSGGQTQKLERVAQAGGEGSARGHEVAAVPAWLETAVSQCVVRLEERMWHRIGPRLDDIERKQDAILERLDAMNLKPEKSPD